MTLTRRILEEKRRLIYPLVAALVLNAALYIAVVYPLGLKVAAGQQSGSVAAAAVKAAQRDYESAKRTASGKVSADAELEKFYGEVLPPDQSAARRITSLEIYQLATKAKVNYERAANDVTQDRDSTLGKLSTTVMLSGQYPDIRRFVHELETSPEFLILETVSLSQGADTADRLNVTVRVATYYQAGGDGI